jgi:hypothetical protein
MSQSTQINDCSQDNSNFDCSGDELLPNDETESVASRCKACIQITLCRQNDVRLAEFLQKSIVTHLGDISNKETFYHVNPQKATRIRVSDFQAIAACNSCKIQHFRWASGINNNGLTDMAAI